MRPWERSGRWPAADPIGTGRSAVSGDIDILTGPSHPLMRRHAGDCSRDHIRARWAALAALLLAVSVARGSPVAAQDAWPLQAFPGAPAADAATRGRRSTDWSLPTGALPDGAASRARAAVPVPVPAPVGSTAPLPVRDPTWSYTLQRFRGAAPEVAATALVRPPPRPGAATSLTGPSHILSGVASFYWQPQMTASGEVFDPTQMTAAHKTLPLGTKVRVTDVRSGRSVVVRINDRGPFKAGRVIDLSKAAAEHLGMQSAGLAVVRLEVVGR